VCDGCRAGRKAAFSRRTDRRAARILSRARGAGRTRSGRSGAKHGFRQARGVDCVRVGGLLVATLALAAAGEIQARGVDVRFVGERVSVRAEAAPLSDVLDRLAQRTGMKVVWGKNLGRPNVTVILEDCTPAEAVVRLLQGSGFNYALSMDPSRTRVETLMIVGVPEPALAAGFVRPRRAEPSSDAPPADEAPAGDEATAELNTASGPQGAAEGPAAAPFPVPGVPPVHKSRPQAKAP
jgi:hypothetical protein